MGWFLLIVVLILAAFGILGLVIKLTLTLVFSVLLALIVLGAIAWFSFKHWLRKAQADAERSGGSTTYYRKSGDTYDVQGWVHDEKPTLPPGDDDA